MMTKRILPVAAIWVVAVALVDADHGLLVINPSKGEVAALREYKRAQEGLE